MKNEQKEVLEETDSLPIESTELIYVDNMMGLAVGPFVTKIILGSEYAPNQHTPKITLVMPTNALFAMANHVKNILGAQGAPLGKAYQDFQTTLKP